MEVAALFLALLIPKKKSLTHTDLLPCKHKIYLTSTKQYLLRAKFKDNNLK